MSDIKITALSGVVLLILTACGQRGPLYVPAEKPPTENSTSNKSSVNSAPVNTPTADSGFDEASKPARAEDKKWLFDAPSLNMFIGV